ncbi:porin family protein [Methylocella sp. CPCC 101449]|jgi:outer membrane immunogenic protein|uniref:outer membrane protein n=1 Tax=Methylocella sp. CPCC 101449 TaxID=2987531 RepID=UPI00288D7A16|nr:porin family protein [Methylocella sp. CPCC 101449]MDT2023022.1 porin family protein [Methylocella sp. CPCC 101449]HEV2570329.1 porin family protein [Beijerinckiaceae bacterium]
MLKKLLIGTALAAVASSATLAADLPRRAAPPAPVYVAPIFTWTGFYVGLNAGYGFSGDRTVNISGSPLITNGQIAGQAPFSLSPKRDGFIGGGQIGYNVQSGSFVYGVEVDFQGADIKGSANACAIAGGCAAVITSATNKLEWLGTLRGRVGVSFDRALIYATGGLALGGVRNSVHLNEFAGAGRQFLARSNSTRAGWTLGAGVEYAISNNWSAKLEYLYYDLGSRSAVGGQFNPVGAEFLTAKFKNNGHIVRAGINYRFGGPAGPVVASY